MCLALAEHTDDGDGTAVSLIHAGLIEAYISVITAPRFFDWPVAWRARIYMAMLLVMEGARTDTSARERVFSTTTGLFGSLWTHRSSVKLADRGVMHLGDIEDDSTFLLRLIDKYYMLYMESDRVPGMDTYLNHVHLLTWVLAREEDEVPSDRFEINALLPSSLHAAWGPSLSEIRKAELKNRLTTTEYLDIRDRFVDDCILDGIGGERFIKACEIELRSLLDHNKCDCENHVYDSRTIGLHFITAEKLMPMVFQRDLLGFSLEVMKQLFATEFGAPMCTNLCLFCHMLSYYYDMYSVNHGVRAAAPHQYPDIVDLYVAGVELTAGGCNESVTQGDLQGALTMGLRNVMDRMQEDRDAQEGESPKYMSQLKRRAKPLWYPSLRRLELALPILQRYEHDPPTPVADLLEGWSQFGAFIGLDIDKERKRHEGGMQERCWWRCCAHRGDSDPATRTSKLLQCAGCGQARYCSKECQRIDWKTGGHKRVCRRLK
ncbi:unnamed protein product [Peniophora sp. CBMAI 1063]|nr:unnamed protein product [Peniophora sp. CBMAI 1063]